ncbi:glutathione S-transferase family protein [Dongia sp.]|uniref:glutathione S-transferase family protein n=1 Tax=Dongia sp. TaxID=1977262 RepID=UPI0037529462
MTELFLYGGPHSSFVRATRMALLERNVPHTLVPCAPGHVDGEARHPFSKIPFLRYGDFILAESIAIIRFTEREFPAAPSLWPSDSRRAALCDQWISAVSDSVTTRIGRGICFPRLVSPVLGWPVDEAAVLAAVEKLPATLDELERPLSTQPYLTGATMALADLYLVPQLHYLGLTREGQAALPRYPAIQAWRARMAERPSVQSTIPPSFELLRAVA